MNRYERTHLELKRQLEHLGVYDDPQEVIIDTVRTRPEEKPEKNRSYPASETENNPPHVSVN